MTNVKNNDQENRYKCRMEKKMYKFNCYSRFAKEN